MGDIGWNHIILEGYCAKDWEYYRKEGKNNYLFDKDKEIGDWEPTPNPEYDPNVKKPEWPKFCKKKIGYTCYENDCPHLAIGKGRMKDIIWALKHSKKNKKKRN